MSLHTVLLLTLMVKVSFQYRDVRPTAFIDIILYEPDPSTGRYLTKTSNVMGYFSTVGSTASAEGNIKLMHPLGLCIDSDNDDFLNNYRYGWVGVIKLEEPSLSPDSCRMVIMKVFIHDHWHIDNCFRQAQRAIEKGATAVIFDISNHPEALSELNSVTPNLLSRPVIVVKDEEALKLMKVLLEEVEMKEEARARIEKSVTDEGSSNHIFNMGLFIVCIAMVFVLGIIVVAKVKCFRRQQELSINNLTKSAFAQMATRKYRKKSSKSERTKKANNCSDDICDKSTVSSSGSLCAICLEEFCDGQELRCVPCAHEFHRKCIDKWLNEKWTCPLCNLNVLENLSLGYGDTHSSIRHPGANYTSMIAENNVRDNISMLRNSRSEFNSYSHSQHQRNVAPVTELVNEMSYSNNHHVAGNESMYSDLFTDSNTHVRSVNNNYIDFARNHELCHDSSESNSSNKTPKEYNNSDVIKLRGNFQISNPNYGLPDQFYFDNNITRTHRISDLTERTFSSWRGTYGSSLSIYSQESPSPAANNESKQCILQNELLPSKNSKLTCNYYDLSSKESRNSNSKPTHGDMDSQDLSDNILQHCNYIPPRYLQSDNLLFHHNTKIQNNCNNSEMSHSIPNTDNSVNNKNYSFLQHRNQLPHVKSSLPTSESNIADNNVNYTKTKKYLVPCRNAQSVNRSSQHKYENTNNFNNCETSNSRYSEWKKRYVLDSSDISENNYPYLYLRRKKSIEGLKTHSTESKSYNVYPKNPVDALSDSSVRCLYGSSSIYSTSPHHVKPEHHNSNGHNAQKYNSPYTQWITPNIRATVRPLTPCIGYSSSDGADDLARLSNCSLEEILQSVMPQ